MATIAAIAAAAAVASAATGVYGAAQSRSAQQAANRNNQQAFDWNKSIEQQNAELDMARSVADAQQRILDNRRYDESVGREEKQRDFTNKLATAGQVDSQGNRLFYDPSSGTWRTALSAEGRDEQARGSEQRAAQNTQATIGRTIGAMQATDRASQSGIAQTGARALSQELMARYGANQGRTPQQMEAAGIERNVANATDPLRTGGNMAMLQGYRQGNSGNDALMGALARQSLGGTRAAIADARYAAPTASADERSGAAKALLAPATTLAERGSAAPNERSPVYEPSNGIDKLLTSLQRNNPAGVGTSLNPRSAGLPIRQGGGDLKGFEPLNANGNAFASASAGLTDLLQPNNALMKYLNRPNYATDFASPNAIAPTPANSDLSRRLMNGGNVDGNGITFS